MLLLHDLDWRSALTGCLLDEPILASRPKDWPTNLIMNLRKPKEIADKIPMHLGDF
jgi:hypothetical protein